MQKDLKKQEDRTLIAGVKEDEIQFTLKTLNPNVGFIPLMEAVEHVKGVLHPKTQLKTLIGVATAKERQEAVTAACEMACSIIDYFLIKDEYLLDELTAILNKKTAEKVMRDVDKLATATISTKNKEAARED